MKLLIDIGNSKTKIGIWNHKRLSNLSEYETKDFFKNIGGRSLTQDTKIKVGKGVKILVKTCFAVISFSLYISITNQPSRPRN